MKNTIAFSAVAFALAATPAFADDAADQTPAPAAAPATTTMTPTPAKTPALAKAKVAQKHKTPASAEAASEDLTVEGVRAPAWVEYDNGRHDALIIGEAFSDGQKIHTGPGARVELKLADGSAVKLGENASLALADLAQKKMDDKKNLVTASFDVLVGAFRFTTGLLAKKYDGERDVRVHLVTMTAGIRGTDLWGKASDDGQTLALIDGDITVVHDDGTALEMDKPMTMYKAPMNSQGAMSVLEPDELKTMALETEIVNGQGATARGGHWKVYVGEFNTPDEALALYDKLRIAGYGARIWPVRKEGDAAGFVYQVRIPYLPTQKEAQVLAQQIKDANLATDTRIARN